MLNGLKLDCFLRLDGNVFCEIPKVPFNIKKKKKKLELVVSNPIRSDKAQMSNT